MKFEEQYSNKGFFYHGDIQQVMEQRIISDLNNVNPICADFD